MGSHPETQPVRSDTWPFGDVFEQLLLWGQFLQSGRQEQSLSVRAAALLRRGAQSVFVSPVVLSSPVFPGGALHHVMLMSAAILLTQQT